MSFLKNTVSLLAIFSVMPVAYAVTARPSVMNTATAISASGAVRRMPTMTAYLNGAAGTTTTVTTAGATTLTDTECLDTYTACIKGADACGPNFEECTTNVLFHAQMPECLTALTQCSASGIQSLFGTSNISSLSNVATKNTYGEITEYTYPTTGSVLGQMISAAAISNKYDTSNCVRRYSSCLRKESVCGADFELCTTNTEFKKQAVFCDSTLARCAADGKLELFGNAAATSSTAPSASSRVGEMISEGASLAAVNAVSTCYKVADQCILNACGANPYKCYENATVETTKLVDAINNGTPITELADATATISKSNISSYIKNSCLDTIGSNKYCYATFIGDGMMPTSSQLRDEDNQEEVYDQAYSARMNSGMKAKITELVNKFDTKAKEKCIDTISQCAMRTCGGGMGAACYAQVFGSSDKSINNDYSRNEIKTGCMAVVNSDPNCQYAAQNPNATGTYNYMFTDATAFDTLFPEYDDGAESDPIGVVASLNASLANNYNDAAIAQMKKQCQSVATSCVKSMCGNDYVNCYRNRTDVYSSLTNSGDDGFDKSMNKVGGVLDYTIVLGLCVDTVKNANVCSEHLAIESNKLKMAKNSSAGSWGTGSVRGDWIDAGSTSKMDMTLEQVQAVDENGNDLCTNKSGDQGVCYTVDASGAVYDQPVKIAYTTYVESQAASTLFKDLIYDLEIEAQAKYNAKLTKQQNMCLSSNNGGILGNKDLGSVFMWAKLKSNKVPTNYTTAGLKSNQFVASNDLYGSFCRVRITLQSDDKYIQDAINKGADWSTAYFAAGDAFTCGSWIPNDKLEELANAAGSDARADKKASQPKLQGWMAALGTLGGGLGGAYLGAGIQDGSVFSGLTGTSKKDTKELTVDNCNKYYNSYATAVGDLNTRAAAPTYVNKLISLVEDNDDENRYTTQISEARSALTAYQAAALLYLRTQGFHKDGATRSDMLTMNSNGQNDWGNGACETAFEQAMTEATTHYDTAYNNCVRSTVVSTGQTKEQKIATANSTFATSKTTLDTKMIALQSACKSLANADDDSASQAKKKRTASAIGAGVGAVGGGILAWQITKSIQDANLDKAEQEAIQEFMDNVGSKIRCYIGADEVGMYGDMISTSME